MKKYIGTKTISAEPMTRGIAALHHLLRDEDAKKNPEDAGYHVVYENGYHSWSPADVFEKAYKVADTPLDRIAIECNELADKLVKLSDFIKSDKFDELSEKMRASLFLQFNYMGDYYNILMYRFEAMGGSVNKDIDNNFWTSGLAFSSAISLLQHGFVVRRSGWNGKGMYVVKQLPQEVGENIIPRMNSLPAKVKELLLKGEKKCISYRNQMLLVQPDGTADSWVPSSSDVFAEDWELVI